MLKMRQLLFAALLSCLLVQLSDAGRGLSYERTDKCLPTDAACHYIFVVEQRLTMINATKFGSLVVPHGGKLYGFDDVDHLNPADESKIIQTDAYWQTPRMVIVVNNSLPGPAIEVWEGQTVSIEVRNELHSEAMTIHWHGLLQKGSNIMDGVAYVTQCPILPGGAFTYTFTVSNVGTHFYHSHIGAQRTQGLFGAFIVRPAVKEVGIDLDLAHEHTVMLTDWSHIYESTTAVLFDFGIGVFYGPKPTPLTPNKAIDGTEYNQWLYHSTLLGGKGRFWDVNPDDGTIRHNEGPLAVYNITKGGVRRFRFVNGGTVFPYRISIDQHKLKMIATDGDRFKAREFQSFILSPGERYDFLVTGDQTPGCYWIIAETLEIITSGPRHFGEAILQYESNGLSGTNYDNDTCMFPAKALSEVCTAEKKCQVLNCPFEKYPTADNTECVPITELEALEESPLQPDERLDEMFQNYAYPTDFETMYFAGAINSKEWVNPHVSMTGQADESRSRCEDADPACSPEKICTCIHTVDLVHNRYYQLVIASIGSGLSVMHPAHIHGHHFEVVKIGFTAQMDNGTNVNLLNNDLICLDAKGETLPQRDSFCGSIAWANASWASHGLPDVNPKPVRKDTVNVPPGGYAVVRFPADNPGYWFSHCHIELHSSAGMAMMFNEAPAAHDSPPASFPKCGDFPTEGESDEDNGINPASKPAPGAGNSAYQPACALLLAMILAHKLC